jgi:enoyl-CoA hydratase
MDFNNLLLSSEGHAAIITINRPDQLNALNRQTIAELSHAIDTLEKDPNIRVIILTGSGEKAFVAGADIKEFANFNAPQGAQLAREGQHKLFDKVELCHKPVIAAINGFALGGGLELALSAHIRIAASNARMGLPEVSLGVIPGYGGTQRLARLVGRGRASEMICTAEMITADKALEYNLVNTVVAQQDLLPTCLELSARIAKNSPTAIGLALNALQAGYDNGVDGFEREIENFGKAFETGDFKEGTTAFLQKRKPEFKGV